jgi:transposase
MEVIYPKACGVDVHKSFIVAVICDSTSVKPQYLRKRFSTFNNSLIDFRNWLLANDCQNVCMESTGKYYVPVYNALEGHISNVVVANPKWVRCIKGEKDDNKDAKWIADLFKLGIVRSSFIPNKDIFNAISGITWESSQKQRMNVIQEHIDYLDKAIKTIREIIDSIVAPYESAINLLCSIPGIDRKSAITIISEIGTDMSQFSSHYRLTSWAGLAPGCNESAGKKKSVKISKAGVYLKPALVEVAHCAVKDKENPYYANKFNVLSKRRGKKRAYIAIARKILVAIYHMLSTGELFNPSDASKVETTDKDKIKYTKNNFIQSTKQLISLGITVDELQMFLTSKISESTPVI